MAEDGFTFTSEHHPILGMRPVGVTDTTYTMTHTETGLTISLRTRGRVSAHKLRVAMMDALRHVLLVQNVAP